MMKSKGFKMLITAMLMLLFSASLTAQDPPPPPNDPSSIGGNNNLPVGGGAPIGSGLFLLVAMGLGYGYKKYRSINQHD